MAHLLIRVTEGDPRFGMISDAVMGIEVARLWNPRDISAVTGGTRDPIILLAHANPERFVTHEGPPRVRARGDEVIGTLIAENFGLQRSAFGFCLLAGCSAANQSIDSLFAQVGRALGKPTIASTTSVAMHSAAGRVVLTPQGIGEWKVFFPNEGGFDRQPDGTLLGNIGAIRSLTSDRCAGFRERLADSAFTLKNADGTNAT